MHEADVGGEERALLPLRMVNEFVYCPRLFWLEYVGREFAESYDTIDGQRVHRNVDRPSTAPLPEPEDDARPTATRSVSLSSPTLGVTGTVDLVETDGEDAVPIDYKRGRVPRIPNRAYDPERVQLCLQGLLLREAGYAVSHGILYFAESRTRIEIAFDDELVSLTMDAVRNATAASSNAAPMPPPLYDSPKCPRCSLVGICLPDETNLLRHQSPQTVRPMVVPLDEPAPLYVVKPGAVLGKSEERLQIKYQGEVLDEVRLIDVSHVSLFGNVQMSTQAARVLVERGSPIFYFSYGVWLKAMTIPPEMHSIDVRIAQHRIADDPDACLMIARRIVEGKIRNQRTLVRRSLGRAARLELGQLAFLARRSRRSRNADELLGYEGSAARTYFSCFARMLKQPSGFDFNGRNRRPPRDPVNAVLSFLYALLVRDCVAALLTVGLEPGLGIFHKVRLGRPSLALDLAEEFRPIVADSVALTVLNTGELSPSDFVSRGIGVALTEEGRRALIGAYERRMATTVRHELFGYSISYRRVLAIQARLLARRLQGDIDAYPPFETR